MRYPNAVIQKMGVDRGRGARYASSLISPGKLSPVFRGNKKVKSAKNGEKQP
jgi:hypothetical protein